MKLVLTKTRVSIDHITLTSDDNRYLRFDPYIMSRYKYAGPVKTTNSPENKDVSKTYRMFHEFFHLKTGHKLHVFSDRYNTKDYKTLFAPNLTVKFFSSWDNKLAYSEVAWVHNILVENYHVSLAVSMVHVAVDLFFRSSADPFLQVLGSIKSGRKITPRQHPNYPNTYLFQLANAPFCLVVYDKRTQLLDRKREELSAESLAELDELYVARIESRFRNPYPIAALGDLATLDFSWIYPRHVKFLKADREKLGNRGVKAREFRGLSLTELRKLLRGKGISNNFTYYLREIESLAKPVKAALADHRWEPDPAKYPLKVPALVIPKQRVVFVRH